MKRRMMLLFAAGLFAGCNSGSEDDASGEVTGRPWTLVTVQESGVVTTVPAAVGARITISGDGQVSGSAGCNALGGKASFASGSRVRFTELVQTEMACDEPRMSIEAAFTRTLMAAETWRMENGQLVLESADGARVARLR